MIGWQEGYLTHKKPHYTNLQRFSSGTGAAKGPEQKSANPCSPVKAAVKQ